MVRGISEYRNQRFCNRWSRTESNGFSRKSSGLGLVKKSTLPPPHFLKMVFRLLTTTFEQDYQRSAHSAIPVTN
jgi:hypothetical protein